MVLLFVLTVISLNCAFAVDMTNDTDSVQAFDEDVISDDVLADDNVGSFQDLNSIIENANSGDTVVLEKNYTYDSTSDSNFTSGILVDKQLTIDGDGKTVDANKLARIFNVTADNVLIKNINFINGYYTTDNGQAGCVVWNGESGELKNCNFDDSYAKIAGAVLWNGDNGLVDGCNFTGNSAMTTAAAIYWDGANGRINNSYFSKNHVTTKGGALYSSYNDNITLENCIFESNYAALFAGAIAFDYVSANIINSTFKGNYLMWSMNGGAIQFTGNSSNSCNLSGCIFESNRAGTGTSIYSTIPLTIEDSTFSDSANSKAVVTTSDLTLKNNTLNNDNLVFVNGGKILSPTTVIVMNGTTLKADVNSNVTLTGVIYDDNNNTVLLNSIDFIIDDDEIVTATFLSNGTFTADYTISDEGAHVVSVNATDKLVDPTIYTAQLKSAESLNISIDVLYAVQPIAVVNVSSPVDGIYNLTVGESTISFNVTDGNAYVTLILDSGNYNLTVSFSGNDDYAATSKTTPLTVKDNKVASKISITVISGSFNITGILTDIDDNPIAKAEITYNVDGGEDLTATTDGDGIFEITVNENSVVELSFAGDDSFLPSNASITLKDIQTGGSSRLGSVVNVTNGQEFVCYAVDYNAGERGKTFDVLLTDSNGNPLANTTVLFGINGYLHNKTTDENGIAKLPINLMSANTYTVAVCYLGDDSYNATFAVGKLVVNKKPITITASAKTFKVTTKTKKYTVTLKTIAGSSSDGNIYLKSGKKVTLTINGVTYTAKTNANGQATFSIKLNQRGVFSSKISFAGSSTYEAVTKTVKITIK